MQNIPLQYNRLARKIFATVTALLLLWASASSFGASSLTTTRIGSCDWTCSSERKEPRSCHQRLDKALESCANLSFATGEDHLVFSAQYRISTQTDGNPEPPPPDPDPPPKPDPDPPSTGSFTVTWIAPTFNEDGTPLTDLKGYKLYYGTASGSYDVVIDIDNPNVLNYVIEPVPIDTYYVVGTAYNTRGEESRYSGEAVKVVQ